MNCQNCFYIHFCYLDAVTHTPHTHIYIHSSKVLSILKPLTRMSRPMETREIETVKMTFVIVKYYPSTYTDSCSLFYIHIQTQKGHLSTLNRHRHILYNCNEELTKRVLVFGQKHTHTQMLTRNYFMICRISSKCLFGELAETFQYCHILKKYQKFPQSKEMSMA